MSGFSWTRADYASHEAICPECGQGGGFGTGKYAVEVRAYFEGKPPESIERKLTDLRIKCGGACTVGTGDSGGLYLVQGGKCVNWPRRESRAYLLGLGSPLAEKFEDYGELDQADNDAE